MDEIIKNIKSEMRDVVENNILAFWLNNMQDTERGGFYGQMRGDGTLVKDASKGCILNARILWAFSAAYRILGKPEYLEAATRVKDYILEHFIDKENGGAYWELDCEGNPIDTKKQFYAIGFVIYGLSEYARAIMNKEGMERTFDQVLNEAFHLFFVIERHSWDKEFGGYIEATTCDWEPIADMRLSDLDANYPKSQNTHLHIIEPYTNLYRALKEYAKTELYQSMFAHSQHLPDINNVNSGVAIKMKALENALRSLINIFTDKILNPETHHLDLFFDMDWTRGAGWLESYGHDIECSWLMHEAALVLGDKSVLAKVEPIVQLVAKASEKGLNADGSMTHEANLDTGHIDDDRHWWVQAEAVVGFMNIYQYFGDESALQKSLNCWQYIKDNLIDNEGGEWFWSRDPQRNINRRDDKAGFWKCPYHNSRMCLEIIERDIAQCEMKS